MKDLTISQSLDAYLIRHTQSWHSTDSVKTKISPVSHTTSARISIAGITFHATSANIISQSKIYHTTDAHKTSSKLSSFGIGGEPEGDTLADSVFQQDDAHLETYFSRNNPEFISIGSGLSTMIGLPRIATWNTAGRPKNPRNGTIGFNVETKCLEFWTGFSWFVAEMEKSPLDF